MKIDLHTHTVYSDGTLTPTELVKLAKKRNIKYLGITDHEVISGVTEAFKAGKKFGVNIVAGIEIDSKVDCSKDQIHLLGLMIDQNSKKLIKYSNIIEKNKKKRTLKRVELVNKYFDSNIKWEDIKEKAAGISSMPHIAMVLYDKKLVESVSEGIKLFRKGSPFYIDFRDDKIHAKDAIRLIHKSEGVAILAHLGLYKFEDKFATFKEQEALVEELKSYGIDGIEVMIPTLSSKEKIFYMKLCKKYHLIYTGGSDFHDEKFAPENKLGCIDLEASVIKNLSELKKKYMK